MAFSNTACVTAVTAFASAATAAAGWEGDGQHCQDIDECAMHIDGEPACWNWIHHLGVADGAAASTELLMWQAAHQRSAVPYILQRVRLRACTCCRCRCSHYACPYLVQACPQPLQTRRLRPAVREHPGVLPLRVQEGIHPGEGRAIAQNMFWVEFAKVHFLAVSRCE